MRGPWWRERMLVTAAVTLPVIAGIGFLRAPGKQDNAFVERFWIAKTHWPAAYDVVIAGDSRVYRGVSPAAMAPYLPGRRIANFGYGGAELSRFYLGVAASKLDPRSPHRLLVIGLTPLSLTARAARLNAFTGEFNRPRSDVFFKLYVGGLAQAMRPFPADAQTQADEAASARYEYIQHYHDDGWVESRQVPEDPARSLAFYESLFAGNPVFPPTVATVVRTVEEWTRSGLRVAAFRVPASRAMVELENRVSGFDEADIARQLRAAGGTWVPLETGAYHSYDGSHLRDDAARQLSADLGRALAETPTPDSKR